MTRYDPVASSNTAPVTVAPSADTTGVVAAKTEMGTVSGGLNCKVAAICPLSTKLNTRCWLARTWTNRPGKPFPIRLSKQLRSTNPGCPPMRQFLAQQFAAIRFC
jgi:hypothetical protein